MTPNRGLFVMDVTYGAFTSTGSSVTLADKFSTLGPAYLGHGTIGSRQWFQVSFTAGTQPGVEISTSEGGEKVFTVNCKIVDPTKSAGLVWPIPNSNGWWYETNLWAGGDNTPLPVQLASFSVKSLNGTAELSWTTLSETNNYGFYVQRGSSLEDLHDAEDGFVPGFNTTIEQHDYTWTDKQPARYYRLRQVDLDGSSHFSEAVILSITDVAAGTKEPATYTLQQNFPNPFNPTTTIQYALLQRSHVTLAVFNTLGQKVAELVNGETDAGYHSVQLDGSNLASGVYLYKLQADSFVKTKKLLLVR